MAKDHVDRPLPPDIISSLPYTTTTSRTTRTTPRTTRTTPRTTRTTPKTIPQRHLGVFLVGLGVVLEVLEVTMWGAYKVIRARRAGQIQQNSFCQPLLGTVGTPLNRSSLHSPNVFGQHRPLEGAWLAHPRPGATWTSSKRVGGS